MAFEGVGQRLQGVVVDGNGGDGRGEATSAGTASEYCDFEASVEELIEDDRAEVASGLRESSKSVFGKAQQRK